MSDVKQEALEAAIRAYGPTYSDHTHRLDLSAACEVYCQARRAGEAAAFQVTDEMIAAYHTAQEKGLGPTNYMVRIGLEAAFRAAQRPAQPAGVEWSEAVAVTMYNHFAGVTAISHQFAMYKAGLSVFGALCPVVPAPHCVRCRDLSDAMGRAHTAACDRAEKAERELAECREQLSVAIQHESNIRAAWKNTEAKLAEANAELERVRRELADERAEHQAYREEKVNECRGYKREADIARGEAIEANAAREAAEAREKRLREACKPSAEMCEVFGLDERGPSDREIGRGIAAAAISGLSASIKAAVSAELAAQVARHERALRALVNYRGVGVDGWKRDVRYALVAEGEG